MTNYERIKAMSIEEMAELLRNYDFLAKPCNEKHCEHFRADGACQTEREDGYLEAIKNWLESEVSE